ncbi:MAG: hypothetical protein K9G48_14360 [Reyranella sp.]|nr:hypothetical protein [Reyranella sp.]
MRRSRLWLPCAVITLTLVAGVALAQTEPFDTVETDNDFNTREPPSFPTPPTDGSRFITAEGHIEGFAQFNSNWPNSSDFSAFTTLYGEIDARANVNFGQYFSVNTLLRLERGQELTTSTVFDDEVLFVQRLFGIVHLKPLHFYAGKIHPRFGIGWYATPGLFGTDFDTDYELYDKLGGGVRWDIHAFGRHRFTAEAFQTDTSFLAKSLIPGTQRVGLLNLEDGGAGNTGTFESYALALSGQRIPGLGEFSYQAGWAKQKASPVDVRDEYSWSIGGIWPIPLTDDVSFEPMAEFVSVSGQGGADQDVDYLTLSATLRLGAAWSIAVHTTQRYVRDYSEDQYRTDSLAGVAVAYEFGDLKDRIPWLDGFTGIVGYRQATTFGISSQTLGMQLKYTLDF